jgi:hypothetical protein
VFEGDLKSLRRHAELEIRTVLEVFLIKVSVMGTMPKSGTWLSNLHYDITANKGAKPVFRPQHTPAR